MPSQTWGLLKCCRPFLTSNILTHLRQKKYVPHTRYVDAIDASMPFPGFDNSYSHSWILG